MEGVPSESDVKGMPMQSAIQSYHAHVYYDPNTDSKAEATRLRDAIAEQFATRLGRWHDVPVGPHTQAMYQVAFAVDVFPGIVPWMMLNRGPLTILVHPNTGRPKADHLHHALWMGAVLPIKEDVLPEIEESSAP
ncbi:MAG: aromatic ring-cleaving dioxygenase [Betaproteobacteria bacterium]|nr:aromatic ring-cleaving dioxygenase [Betaproteobacteria bacterium]